MEGLNRLLEECTPTQKNAILRYISDFFNWLKSKFSGDPYISTEIRDLENKFKELIADANTVTEGETEQENTSFSMPSDSTESVDGKGNQGYNENKNGTEEGTVNDGQILDVRGIDKSNIRSAKRETEGN